MQQETSYAKAIGRKYPEAVVIAVARDPQGYCNPITLGWSMIVSGEPPMLAVAINAGAHSVGAFRHSRAFVLGFPSAAQAEEALFYGTRSGRDVHKLEAYGAATQPATAVDGVLLSDAVANFECVLESETPAGDHIVFVGRVVASHAHSDPSLERLYSLGGGALGPALPGDTLAQR